MNPVCINRANLGQKTLIKKSVKTLHELLDKPYFTLKKSYNRLKDLDNAVTKSNSVVNKSCAVTCKTKAAKKGDKSRTVLISENVEFYPDRLKRNMPMRKIVLQPKHDYKIIATTNKRKRRIPHKEEKLESLLHLPDTITSLDEEQSIEELVRLAEEQGLDEEDFIEILTCPSPVWWEDLTDSQDEIHIRFHEDSAQEDIISNEYRHTRIEELYEINNNPPVTQTDEHSLKSEQNSRINIKSDINFFKKFVAKRSKLENVLDNIKFRRTKPEHQSGCDSNESNNKSNNKVRNDSGGLSDASINEEELLNILENIKIPSQEFSDDKLNNTTETEDNDIEIIENSKAIVKNDHSTCKKTRNRKQRKLYKSKKKSKALDIEQEKNAHEVKDLDDFKVISNEVVNIDDFDLDPSNIPLIKNSFGHEDSTYICVSPKSIDSVTSDTASSNIIECDSISDTNIKFLDEFDDTIESNKKDANELKKNESKIESKESELVAIYKIMVDESDDIEDQIKTNYVCKQRETIKSNDNNFDVAKDSGKINAFYKKRKNCYRSNTDGKTDKSIIKRTVKKRRNKLIGQSKRRHIIGENGVKILNSNAKYCLKCSSIFETDSCQYCLKNT